MSDTVCIESLDGQGRGVARFSGDGEAHGKVIFVEGALPREIVRFVPLKKKKNWDVAKMTLLLRESPFRVLPRCPHFGVCGGCALQHVDAFTQIAIKQRILEDNLWHIGRVTPRHILRPIMGPWWEYRTRARLSVNHVPKKGGVLVGFHERRSRFVCDMRQCAVLPRSVSDLLLPLRALLGALSICGSIPQIELAKGNADHTVMVLRIMKPLSDHDKDRLRQFADRYDVQWWLQTGGPDTATLFYPEDRSLQYALPEFGITIPFLPLDFTQVNHHINAVLVSRVIHLLSPQAGERVADLFCGLGNFSLPIATRGSVVTGMEGSAALTKRAVSAAMHNGLAKRTHFVTKDLFAVTAMDWAGTGKWDRVLLDPPRDGAEAVCRAVAELSTGVQYALVPKRMVYVSCNPSTLARDAAILVHEGGYTLTQAGIVNMFPHTSHVESVAVFERS